MGGGGAHQLADVVDGDLAALAQPLWVLGLAHRLLGALRIVLTGRTSSTLSSCDCSETEIAPGSPITQPWL